MSATHTPILLCTGSDTAVGKTVISALIVLALRQRGLRVKVMKPVETGCQTADSGELMPADGAFLRAAAGGMQALEEVVPWRFSAPLAPMVAAAMVAQPIDPRQMIEKTQLIARDCDLLLVEGAGGILVPIAEGFSFADFAQKIGAAVLPVIGSRLGAVNHAILTIEALRSRTLKIPGYILNNPFQEESPEEISLQSAALATNHQTIKQLAGEHGVSELFYLEYLGNQTDLANLRELLSRESVQRLARSLIDYYDLPS